MEPVETSSKKKARRLFKKNPRARPPSRFTVSSRHQTNSDNSSVGKPSASHAIQSLDLTGISFIDSELDEEEEERERFAAKTEDCSTLEPGLSVSTLLCQTQDKVFERGLSVSNRKEVFTMESGEQQLVLQGRSNSNVERCPRQQLVQVGSSNGNRAAILGQLLANTTTTSRQIDKLRYDSAAAEAAEQKQLDDDLDIVVRNHYRPRVYRDLNSPTKSLQLDSSEQLLVHTRDIPAIRRISLSAGETVAGFVQLNRIRISNCSLASMISLPGVPPVLGVSRSPIQKQQEVNNRVKKASRNTPVSSRMQSEEDLILDYQRKKEFSVMRPTKLREESSILKNIQRREMMDKMQNSSQLEKREKEEKKRIHHQFGIASGLIRSRALLLAPIAPVDIEQTSIPEEEPWKPLPPPSSDQPHHRRIVRKVVAAHIENSPEITQLAETRFSESKFVMECLEWHNTYRKMHSAPPLAFNAILCATAQHWANMLAHKGEFYHQNPAALGENLFAWVSPVAQSPSPVSLIIKKKPDVSGKDVAVYWYKSRRYYDYEKNARVLHAHGAQFTQMVWSASEKFGCGKARSRSGKVIVVAYYEPKGNIPGLFHRNVFAPSPEDDDSSGVTENGNLIPDPHQN